MEQNNTPTGKYESTIDVNRLYKTAKATSWRYSECNRCGRDIWFDDEITGRNGRMIPLEAGYGKRPHICKKGFGR